MEENGVGYKLNKVQLTRIGEIFRPFFDELENTLISHIVYRVSFSRDFNTFWIHTEWNTQNLQFKTLQIGMCLTNTNLVISLISTNIS